MLEANGVGEACRSRKAPAIAVAESLVKSVKLSLTNRQCGPQFQERVEIRQAGVANGDYAQHLAVVRGLSDVCEEHPHPVPPLDFTAASSAQHALTPAGAGPPQQLSRCVFRDSPELGVV
jgi:hypothetical protein